MCFACTAMTAVEERRLPPRTEWVWAELELQRGACGLGAHPYVTGWREGRLTHDDLRVFAAEQERVVLATSAVAQRAAAGATGRLHARLATVAADLTADVHRWRAFADVVGRAGSRPLGLAASWERAAGGASGRAIGTVIGALWGVTVAHLDVAPGLAPALAERYGVETASRGWFERRPSTSDRLAILEAIIDGTLAPQDPYPALLGAKGAFAAVHDGFDALENDRAIRAQEAVLS